VTVTPSGVLLRIPVIRGSPGEPFRERLTTYLEERNASPKGPGTLVVEGDMVWCVCEVAPGKDSRDNAALTASALVAQVERLGPKILNLR